MKRGQIASVVILVVLVALTGAILLWTTSRSSSGQAALQINLDTPAEQAAWHVCLDGCNAGFEDCKIHVKQKYDSCTLTPANCRAISDRDTGRCRWVLYQACLAKCPQGS